MKAPKERSDIQGEGDYRSAREFNEKERAFVRSHDTEKLAEDAQPDDAAQAAEMERAERAGKARARPDPETDAPDAERDKDGGATGITPPRP
jgi:hypothetical protein